MVSGLLIFPDISPLSVVILWARVALEPAVTIVIGNSQNLFDPSQNNKTCYYFHQVFLNRETKPGDHDQPVQLFTEESWIIRIRKNVGITVELQKTCLAIP